MRSAKNRQWRCAARAGPGLAVVPPSRARLVFLSRFDPAQAFAHGQ
jgi:hypothetical protein